MQRLTEDLPAVMLAVSLHAPNQEVRLKIVPAASAHKIDKIMAAIDAHIKCHKKAWWKKKEARGLPVTEEEWETRIQRTDKSGQETHRPNKITGVMIEYILIKDVNDLEEHAHELGRLLAPRREHILLNLVRHTF
jgi:adenine C2-methylase RlmN of 23S rRNA A2503 and tRNA A37